MTAPALAASSDIAVTVVASCNGRTGIITVTAAFVPSGAELQITLTHSGSGSFTAQPQFAHTGTGTTYIVEGTGAPFTGQISVQLTGIGQNGTGTVTADVSSPGAVVTGTTRASISARREGNSQNYVCSTGA